ncbi:hypothetical protein NW762_004443 [Fusarium torreyae]|uniref:Uncharacterized protein n=1 Tax=Fusarium torreyae TaxID=1237075 RepID=A0A9W8S635_9HYPO|nr:hypothetical protein NW762_004443 [Fusarium torreyae]
MADPEDVVEVSDDSSDESSDNSSGAEVGWEGKLLRALNSIESTGKIATFNRYSSFINPGLKLKGNRLIPLPLQGDDAQAIKSVCRQAPFGHGDQTLVDKSVIAKPHKLLLYEPGSFFKPHKDSEKEQGMVGTLVVCLLSQHEGANIHLSFGSQRNSCATAPTSKFDLASISWFSDVTLEVKELISGYRLVLTYKLFVLGEESVSASTVWGQTENLKAMLIKWQTESPVTEKLMYPLDHQYTESSLCLGNMKGRDRAVGHSLNKVCSEAGFYLLFAHATHVHHVEEGYGYYNAAADIDKHYTMLNAVYDPNGNKVASDVSISIKEILGYSTSGESAEVSEDEGNYTGNESASFKFRYHKTVIVLAPKMWLMKYLKNGIYGDHRPKAVNDRLTEMVCWDLANNRDDRYTIQSAIAFMRAVIDSKVYPQAETMGLISKWALELDSPELFWTCVRTTYAPLGARPRHVNDSSFYVYRMQIGQGLANYLTTHYNGKEETIDWDHWLQGLREATDIATEFDAFCAVFKSLITHRPLLESFKLWAGPLLDEKIKTQSSWTKTDEQFLLSTLRSRSADGEWALQSFFPAIAPKAERFALWDLLHLISLERHSYFRNAKELYKCVIEHGAQNLCLSGPDLLSSAYRYDGSDLSYDTPCKKFVRMLEESYINGAGQEALGLLEQSCSRLAERGTTWPLVTSACLTNDFLVPLVQALETNNVPPVPAVQEVLDVALLEICHKPLNFQPIELRQWAHEPFFLEMISTGFAGWEVPDLLIWVFKEAIECYAIALGYPHTLVVTKLGTNYDRGLRIWQNGFRQADVAVHRLRNDYLKGFLGEEKYNELILLQKPGQQDLRDTMSRKRQGYESVSPNAKRTRML